nr:uncharacterized protein LOC127347082 [Lolium perenne]
MAKLVRLQFKFQYKRGADNGAADALSRVGHLLTANALYICQPKWVQEVANSYETDYVAQTMLARLAIHSPNEEGFELHNGLIRSQNRLWIGSNSALRTKLISAFHTSAIGGHSGTAATYHRLKKLFIWHGLKTAVDDFVRQCQVCQLSKHEHNKTTGKLQPLPVPEVAWQDISMDFITGLPKSDGYDVIMVVVDRLTKFAHFVPLKHPFSASQVARALWDNVVKIHGVPLTIVSDRDTIFTSAVWRETLATAGTKLLYSTAYHPQTDGSVWPRSTFGQHVDLEWCSSSGGGHGLVVTMKHCVLSWRVHNSVSRRKLTVIERNGNLQWMKMCCSNSNHMLSQLWRIGLKFGNVAYKLTLPADSRIHPVFHVSQLKPFNQNYSPMFADLPKPPDLPGTNASPAAILERRMVKKGSSIVIQLKIQWDSMSPEATTWEDYEVPRLRYPIARIWDGASSQGGNNVTPVMSSSSVNSVNNIREGAHARARSSKSGSARLHCKAGWQSRNYGSPSPRALDPNVTARIVRPTASVSRVASANARSSGAAVAAMAARFAGSRRRGGTEF